MLTFSYLRASNILMYPPKAIAKTSPWSSYDIAGLPCTRKSPCFVYKVSKKPLKRLYVLDTRTYGNKQAYANATTWHFSALWSHSKTVRSREPEIKQSFREHKLSETTLEKDQIRILLYKKKWNVHEHYIIWFEIGMYT